MKRLVMSLVLAAAVVGGAATARAHDAYDDSEANPIRLAAYAVNPVGWFVEWVAIRPLHFLVSNPQLERIFGHVPHENPFGDYGVYEPETHR